MREYYSIGYRAACSGGVVSVGGPGGRGELDDRFIVLAGKFRLHTSVLGCAAGRGGLVSYRRFSGVARFEWEGGFAARLVEAQLGALEGGLAYAREFVSASRDNKLWLLGVLEGEGYDVGEEREFIGEVDLEEPGDLDQLRAYEAAIHRAYYEALRKVIPGEYGFVERTRRPPRDPFSAALSYGNMVLYGYVSSSLRAVGFDTRVGFLHVPFRDRESLVYDVAEEFRQPVVDAVIVPLFTGGTLRRGHFVERGGVYLSRRGRGLVAEALRKRMGARVGGATLLDHLRRQCESLAESLLGGGGYRGFRVSRYL